MTKKDPDTKTYRWHNENPSNRKTGDCVIRAIAKAVGRSWDEVLDDLVAVAHKKRYMISSVEGYDIYLKSLGWIKQKQPRKHNNKKYTGKEFCEYLMSFKNRGPVLAHIGGHHLTVFVYEEEDCAYKCYDIWDCTDGCIGNYWVNC